MWSQLRWFHRTWRQGLTRLFKEILSVSDSSRGWRHVRETLPALLVLCEANPPVTGRSPRRQVSNAGFDIFVVVRVKMNTLNKQSSCRWCHMTVMKASNLLLFLHYLKHCSVLKLYIDVCVKHIPTKMAKVSAVFEGFFRVGVTKPISSVPLFS